MGAQVSMFQVFRSWAVMEREEFENVMRLMMYMGNIGAPSTLETYRHAIGNVVDAYGHAAAMVRFHSVCSC